MIQCFRQLSSAFLKLISNTNFTNLQHEWSQFPFISEIWIKATWLRTYPQNMIFLCNCFALIYIFHLVDDNFNHIENSLDRNYHSPGDQCIYLIFCYGNFQINDYQIYYLLLKTMRKWTESEHLNDAITYSTVPHP